MEDNIFRAFTVSHGGIANRLITQAEIHSGEAVTSGNALWDTGATITCISHSVVEHLGLVPTGHIDIKTPSGTAVMGTYVVDIMLPNHVMVTDARVCEAEIDNQGISVLIGMDIIASGDFAISNHNSKTVFTFEIPSKKVTDYVKEINLERLIGPKHGKGKRKHK